MGILDKIAKKAEQLTSGKAEELSAMVVDTIKKGKIDKQGLKDKAVELLSSSARIQPAPAAPNMEHHNNGVVKVTEETTAAQDAAFVDSLMNVKAPVAATPLQTGQAAMEAVGSLMTMSHEVMKFTEVQKTKRTQINADKEVVLAHIEATSRLLADYLQKTHDERSSVFQKQFEVIDHALKSGDIQELALTLNAMNDLAKSSPFKNLADVGQVQNMLQDDSTEFDF